MRGHDVAVDQHVPEANLHVDPVSRPLGAHRGLEPDGYDVVSQPGQRHGDPLDLEACLDAIPDRLGQDEALTIEADALVAPSGNEGAVRQVMNAHMFGPAVTCLA